MVHICCTRSRSRRTRRCRYTWILRQTRGHGHAHAHVHGHGISCGGGRSGGNGGDGDVFALSHSRSFLVTGNPGRALISGPPSSWNLHFGAGILIVGAESVEDIVMRTLFA